MWGPRDGGGTLYSSLPYKYETLDQCYPPNNNKTRELCLFTLSPSKLLIQVQMQIHMQKDVQMQIQLRIQNFI